MRHNLSLNKCFEKVENKNGNSSRKGCLWALNPAKVNKMQEELHKWRRKDPMSVRKSMAKPEDLDRLLGEKPDRFRSLPSYNTMSSRLHTYNTSSQHYRPIPVSQQSLYVPPRPNHSFTVYSPCGQQQCSSRSLSSPVAEKMSPTYSVALQDGPKSMHDLLLDGDTGCDIDTLNPSLTDLQLQGNLWEELKEDSTVSDLQVVNSLRPCTSSPVESTTDQGLQGSITPTSEWLVVSRDSPGVQYGDKDTGRLWGADQYNYLNGRNLGAYSGVESFTGCLSSCTTPISLM